MNDQTQQNKSIEGGLGSLADSKGNDYLLLKIARSRSGVLFDPNSHHWSWRDQLISVSVNFQILRPLLSTRLLQALKSTLIWSARVNSPNTLLANFQQFQQFICSITANTRAPLEEIGAIHILNFKASLAPEAAWRLGRVATVIRRWHALQLPGVAEAIRLLDEMRIGGGPKGVSVMTMCPLQGPFTNLEQESIQAAIDEAFVEGQIDESTYLLTWLFLALGGRPVQYAALKLCDLVVTGSTNDGCTYTLRVPRGKQRSGVRASFKERTLIPQIGRPLWAYTRRLRAIYATKLADPDSAPIFPQKKPGAYVEGFKLLNHEQN